MDAASIYVSFIFACLLLRYIYVSFVSNHLNMTSYFPLFGLLYVVTYYLTKKMNLALFTSLVTLMGRTIYRYQAIDLESINKLGIRNTILFILGISLPFLVSHYKKHLNNNYIDGFNFAGLIYVMLSCLEYLLHKYTMHCDRESKLVKMIKKIPFVGNEFFVTCDRHIEHHLDVEKDMHIDEPSSEQGWAVSAYLAPITMAIMAISRKVSNFDISNRMILVLSLVLCFIWQYIWNKVHVEMHNLENKYSIKKGPYDQGLFDLNPVTRVLFTNHANHHLQKGEKKGNYNVIVMGADEWFGANNKTPDNIEYCKTNKNDKVCQ